MAKVFDVANFFIDLVQASTDDQITNLKLNKLLYFAQGAHLARTGEKLFDNALEAWQYGPVVPCIYQKYRVCGKSPIVTVDEDYDPAQLTEDETNLLLDVMREYGKYTGEALVAMTHKADTPWSKCYIPGKNVQIGNDLLCEFFKKNPVPEYCEIIKAPIISICPHDWYDEAEDAEWEAYL